MRIIESIKDFFGPDGAHKVIVTANFGDLLEPYMLQKTMDEVVKALVEKYCEAHADDVLKRIHEQVTDQKIIQKVVQNLRKELKGESK